MTPRPPTHREPTDEEMQCLPEGTLTPYGSEDVWVPSARIGQEMRSEFKRIYAVPITKQEEATLHEPITREALNKALRERDEARAEARESLRDKYAIAIIGGLCANPSVHQANEISGWKLVNCTPQDFAGYALHLTDAMLAARNNQPEKV